MRIRGVRVVDLAEAAGRLAMPRRGGVRATVRRLLAPTGGRTSLSADEKRLASGVDSGLRRLGVRCLRRSIVVTEMLRRRGVSARIRLTVSPAHRGEAHAVPEVDGEPLFEEPPHATALR